MRKSLHKGMRIPLLTLMLLLTGAVWSYGQITSFPYVEDFETWGSCPTGCGSACGAQNGWTQSSTDDIDWTADQNGTGSTATGPTAQGGADHNPGISGGTYLYTEASGCATDTAILISPIIEANTLASNLTFEFWYHTYGANINNLYVDLSVISGGVNGPWVNQLSIIGTANNVDVWQQGLVNLAPYIGDTIQIRFRGVTGTSFGSDLAIDDVQIYSLLDNDAGVISIDNPVNPVTPGVNNVDISIKNFGFDTLNNATIEWEFDGVSQTPFAWTGAIPFNGVSGSFNIGTVNFVAGLRTLKAWTSMPNMVPDSANGNDTMMVTLCSPLAGAYTIGAGGDFNTFAEAADILNNCGISASVTLTALPGVYSNDNFRLVNVPGSSSLNTITVDGGSATLVTLVDSTNGQVVQLSGVTGVTIKNMTIESFGSTDSYGVYLSDSSDFIMIDSCHIKMLIQAGVFDVQGVLASSSLTSTFGEGVNTANLTVSNCEISGGDMGIHIEGSFSYMTPNVRIMNNIMVDIDDYGVYMDDADSVMIMGNYIRTVSGFADGLYMFDINNYYIEENDIAVADWGIYISDGNDAYTPPVRSRVVNNMVSSTTDYAIYLNDFESTDVWHNSFWGGTYGTYINDDIGMDFRNNIVVGDGLYAYYSIDGTPVTNLDNNVYWNTSAGDIARNGGTIYPTLAAWQTGVPANNANSVEGDPFFIARDDLHALGVAPNDAGDNAVGITVDIDGDTRPITPSITVDIGADEFTPRANDAVFVSLLEPGGVVCGDSNTAVTVVILSQGLDTITNLGITVDVTGDITQTLNFTYTGPLTFSQMDTITVGTINTYGGAVINLSGYLNLANDEDLSNDTLNPTVNATFIPVVPQGIAGYGCGVDSTLISGAMWPGVQYQWFANPTDTVPLSVGNDFMIPSITTQSTYYLQYNSLNDSLVTTYAGGNGQQGNMFDIRALQDVQILSFAGNLNSGTHTEVKVWYRPSSYTANPNSNVGWTLLGTANNVVSTGNGGPTQIPIPVNITIPAGQVYGFYIETSSGVAYTNGSTVGSVFAANTYFEFLEGLGKGNNFASNFSPRVWNGTIYFGGNACSTTRVPVSAVVGAPAMVSIADTSVCDTALTLNANNSGNMVTWSTGAMGNTTTINTSGMYYVDVVDTNGCFATDSAMIDIFAPISTNLGNDTLLCDGSTAVLDAGNPGASFVWSSGGSNQTETVSTAGLVSVVVTDSNGCTATDTISVSTANTPSSMFNFTVAGNGLDYAFTDLTTGVPTSWAWDFGDASGTSTSQNPSYSYAVDGSYTVTLIVTNVCGSDTTTMPVVVTYFTEGLGEGFVRVYPNPNNGQFQIDFHKINSENIRMTMTDIHGRAILNKTVAGNGDFKEEVNMNSFSKGVYMLTLEIDGNLFTKRIVVE